MILICKLTPSALSKALACFEIDQSKVTRIEANPDDVETLDAWGGCAKSEDPDVYGIIWGHSICLRRHVTPGHLFILSDRETGPTIWERLGS